MNWFETILAGLNGQMETPTSYGWFHLLAFLCFQSPFCLTDLLKTKLQDEKFLKMTKRSKSSCVQ